MYKLHTQCRACQGKNLFPVFSLGVQPLANEFRYQDEPRSGAVPLEVLYCPDCSLAQLSAVVDPSILYSYYPYITSESDRMLRHFATLRDDLRNIHGGSLGKVLEIGSNDGRFLQFLKPDAADVFGIDPSGNLSNIANKRGIPTLCGFWCDQTARSIPHTSMSDTIIARHVFAHCDDWRDFIAALDRVAASKAVIAIEVPYAGDMLRDGIFDTIYHEHLSYPSIRSMHRLLQDSPFVLANVLHYDLHGGCVVFVLRRRGVVPSTEENDELTAAQWHDLATSAKAKIHALRAIVKILTGTKLWRICGYGAPAKSTVWINACEFNKGEIEFLHDTTPQKQGRLSPGAHIPVIDGRSKLESEMTHAILFAWNYQEEIIAKEKRFRDRGGKFIVPVPTPQII